MSGRKPGNRFIMLSCNCTLNKTKHTCPFWYRIYKMPDGKPDNRFAFNGEFKNAEFAHQEYFSNKTCLMSITSSFLTCYFCLSIQGKLFSYTFSNNRPPPGGGGLHFPYTLLSKTIFENYICNSWELIPTLFLSGSRRIQQIIASPL